MALVEVVVVAAIAVAVLESVRHSRDDEHMRYQPRRSANLANWHECSSSLNATLYQSLQVTIAGIAVRIRPCFHKHFG